MYRDPRLGAALFALSLSCATASCGGKERSSCEPPPVGGLPVPEGGLCSFECPIASASDATPDDDYVLAAAPFFEAHCIRCHDSARTVVQCTTPDSPTCRYGAPLGLNWNDAASIRAHLAEIREAVGVMPYLMPPDLGGDGGPVGPSCEARHRLVRFIDVGAPGLP